MRKVRARKAAAAEMRSPAHAAEVHGAAATHSTSHSTSHAAAVTATTAMATTTTAAVSERR
jgi:hypothetical protein